MKYERWTKKDFTIKWGWHRGRLQGQENRGWYEIYWNKTGKLIEQGFPNKKWAEKWLGDFLKKANKLRKEATERGII